MWWINIRKVVISMTNIMIFRTSREDYDKISKYLDSINTIAGICNKVLTSYYYKTNGDIDQDVVWRMMRLSLHINKIKVNQFLQKQIQRFIADTFSTARNSILSIPDIKSYIRRTRWLITEIKVLLGDIIELNLDDDTAIKLIFEDLQPCDSISSITLRNNYSMAVFAYYPIGDVSQKNDDLYIPSIQNSINRCKDILGIPVKH
jgi:hypothetical protein